jgi:tetratricopeptide (TPR) repeat protein
MTNDTAPLTWEEYNESGRRLFAAGDVAGAEEAFTAAIAEAERGGEDPLQLASSLSSLAQLKYQQKDALRAEELFRRALTLREETLGADDKSVITSINNLAALYVSRGALDDAEPLLKRAMAASVKRVESSQGDLAINLNNLARLYFKRGDYVQAEPLLLRLLTLKRPLGPEHPEVATVLVSLAKVRQALGKNEAAERVWRRVLNVRERTLAATDPAVLQAVDGLADSLAAQGKLVPAVELRERALGSRIASMGAEHPLVAAMRTKLEETRAALASAATTTATPIRVKRPVSIETTGVSGLTPATDRAPIELEGPVVVAASTMRRSMPVAAVAPIEIAATDSNETGFGGRIAAAAGNGAGSQATDSYGDGNGALSAPYRKSIEVRRPTPTPVPSSVPSVQWVEPVSKPTRVERTSTRKRVLNFGNVVGGGGGGGGRTLTIALGVVAVVGCVVVGGIVFGPALLGQLHAARPAVVAAPKSAAAAPKPIVDSAVTTTPVAAAATVPAPDTVLATAPAAATVAMASTAPAKSAAVAGRPTTMPPANAFAAHMGRVPSPDTAESVDSAPVAAAPAPHASASRPSRAGGAASAPDQDQLPPPPSVDIDSTKKP